MRYKNLVFAYSLEIMIGLVTSFLIIIIGPNAIAFIALFAMRPLILEREKISNQDKFWFYSFQLGKYTLFTLSIIIICFYLFNEFISSENILHNFRDRINLLIPLYLLVHGVIGLLFRKKL